MPLSPSLRPQATLAVRNAVLATCDRGPSDAGLVLSLGCPKLRRSPAEALVAFSAGGARSPRRGDLGRLSPGAAADCR